MRQLTARERAQVVSWYAQLGSVTVVRRKFRASYNRTPPSRKTVLKWVNRFSEEGSVENKKHDRSRTTRSTELSNAVLGAFECPGMSISRAARLFDIGTTTVHRILREASFYPYKLQVVHQLREGDYERRIRFCKGGTPAHIRQPGSHRLFAVQRRGEFPSQRQRE